ncbi:MAG: hypothetical protein H0V53_06640 [Rubrobacter sp.]|nr:hypothetical protein [Rubrobacter sp.]
MSRWTLGLVALLLLGLLIPPALLLGPASGGASAAVGEFPVADTSSHQKSPGIGGNTVVWEDDRDNVSNIYGKNLDTGQEFLVATGVSIKRKPVTNGNFVVWEDNRSGDSDIYGYDLAAQQEFLVASGPGDQRKPAINGNTVVWEDNRSGSGWEIYSYDLSSRQESPVATGAGNKTNVSVGDKFVVWQDDRDGSPDIYAKNLETGEEIRVTTNASSEAPAVSGSIVVWQQADAGNFNIFGRDLLAKDLETGKEFQITSHTSDQVAPSISGKLVVWQDGRNGNSDVYGKDLETGQEFQIAVGSKRQESPKINGETVVWETQRDGETNFGTYDIYGTKLDAAPAAPRSLSASGSPEGVGLKWTANQESDLAGYNVYRSGSADGDYGKLNTTLLTAPSYSDSEALEGFFSHYRVTAVDEAGNESAPANTKAAAVATSSVSLNASSTKLDSGGSTSLSGRLTAGDRGLSGKQVVLEQRPSGSSAWTKLAIQPAPTAADGSFSLADVRPQKSTSYRARFAGGPEFQSSTSAAALVSVSMPTSLEISASPSTLVAGSSTRLSGKLLSEGQALSGKRVVLEQRPAGSSSFAKVPGQHTSGVLTADDGTFGLAGVKPLKNTVYRARFAGGPDLKASTSPLTRVNVKAKVSVGVSPGKTVSTHIVAGSVVTAKNGTVSVTIKRNGTVVSKKSVSLINSRYRLDYNTTRAGKYTVNASFPKDFDNLGNVSPLRSFTVSR